MHALLQTRIVGHGKLFKQVDSPAVVETRPSRPSQRLTDQLWHIGTSVKRSSQTYLIYAKLEKKNTIRASFA
jgi:hypothetical protein